jgi:hypothetical protein
VLVWCYSCSRLPTAAVRVRDRGQVMCDLWWTKFHWCKFRPSTSASPANSHSTDCSTLIWDCYNKPNSGRSTKWTQCHPMRKIIITIRAVLRNFCVHTDLSASHVHRRGRDHGETVVWPLNFMTGIPLLNMVDCSCYVWFRWCSCEHYNKVSGFAKSWELF